MPDAPAAIESPCIKVCIIDGATSQCLGCRRTLLEIARWTRYTAAERAAIMAALPGREASAQKR